MYGYIYKTTNMLNGKIYIGQKKSSVFLNESYLGSGKHLKRAVSKYGRENFSIEMIDTAESRDELSTLEIYYIEKFDATNPSVGYNIAKGGIGGGEAYVNNGVVNEFIPKSMLEYYLNNGWQLGMLPGRKEVRHSKTRGSSISKSLKGRHQTAEHTKNHADSIRSSCFHWYTNGMQNLHLREDEVVPEGYVRGRVISENARLKNSNAHIGRTPWNKGLTKESDERVSRYSSTLKNKCKNKVE